MLLALYLDRLLRVGPARSAILELAARSDMSHRVLIITYLFPPTGGVGTPRYVAYTRHLRDHGCQVSVLCPSRPQTPLYDPGLMKRVPPETHIHRVFNPEVPYDLRDRIWKRLLKNRTTVKAEQDLRPAEAAAADSGKGLFAGPAGWAKESIKNNFNPDVQKYWVPFVVRAACRIIREENVVTVILNTPPFSLHAIIPSLKRELPRLKWITEVRDDWLGYYLDQFDSARSDAKHALAVRLEGAGVRASDNIVCVTPAQRDAMRNRYPDQPDAKFLSIPNGFDADLFEDFHPSRQGRSNMVVTYLGSLYRTPVYDVAGYLEALDSLPDAVRDRIETRFIGRIAREAESLLEGRRAKLVKLGFFPRAEAIKLLEQTDYMLLAANDPTTHAGKLFDYLPSGLPTIALTPPEGEIARLLAQTGGGIAVPAQDIAMIQRALIDALARLDGQPSAFPVLNREAVNAFDRRHLLGQLVRLTGINGGTIAANADCAGQFEG